MPFPLRDESDTEFRVDRLLAIFDNPALKLGFFLRQGGAYLALHPDEPLTARRWLEDLFSISVAPWPAEIIEWLVEDGDPVSEGQPLVRVQSREGA
jgi:hypothetical protein